MITRTKAMILKMNNSFSTMVELGKKIEKREQSVKCFTMDEAFLNNILECCVCFEQLDNSSKVLPCQHTFCKRCLHKILNSRKELKCPECRILVDAKIEELPCNILLVRLLEGIKNVRSTNVGGSADIAPQSAKSSSSSQQLTPPNPQFPQPMWNLPRTPNATDLRMVPKQDFDLCISCIDKMENLFFCCLNEDSSTCDQMQTNLEESRILSIQHSIKFLVHVSQCINANCRLPSCQKMKTIIQHVRSCKWPKIKKFEQSVKCFTMDEVFLNDLLKCCVCLEQLDNTSKVLPCQHTFCKRCLYEILNSHKVLRCPECRILVDAKIEELPCNILLIRLMDGIKNIRSKQVGSSADIAPRSAVSSSSGQQQTPPHPQLPQPVGNLPRMPGATDLRIVPKQDFYLCISCKDKMEKIVFCCLDEDSSICDQTKTNLQESQLLSIHRCVEFLVHACQCKDANCEFLGCQKMKKIIQHARTCKRMKNDGCSVCKQLISLCCYHAKYCQEAECPVPFCIVIKNKLKHQQLQHRLQAQAQILQQCVATMQNRGVSNAVHQTSPGDSNCSNQPSPVAQPDSSPHPPQSGICMKPSSRPPVDALQAVQQVQVAAARQTAAHMVAASLSYGNVNPVVVIPPVANTGLRTAIQQMQKPIPQTMSGVSNRMLNIGNGACWEDSGYAQNSQPRQNPQPQPAPQLDVRPQAHIIRPGIVPNSIGNSSMGPPQVMPNSEPTFRGVQRHTQIAWQQFLLAVKSPSTPEKQKIALGILKSNPELMATLIQQKTAGYQKQQQLRQQMLINEGNMITPSPQIVRHEHHHQQQQHFLAMQQQQPNQLTHPQRPMYLKRPRMENPYEF